MSTEYNSTNKIFGAIDMVSHNDNIIEIQDGTAIITLAGSAEAWTFQLPDETYLVSNGRAKNEDGTNIPSKNENIIETTERTTLILMLKQQLRLMVKAMPQFSSKVEMVQIIFATM